VSRFVSVCKSLGTNISRVFFVAVLIGELICLCFIPGGCNLSPDQSYYDNLNSDGGVGGLGNTQDGLLIIDMPFAGNDVHQCTQGPNGDFSHRSDSTRYGVDLDTSNYADEGVFSPVDGEVFVNGSPTSTGGFGYSVNIHIGSGYYVVLGHFSEVAVESDNDVVRGQFLGIDGCTGTCTGDHVHMGISNGSPLEGPEDGTSIPFAIRTRDVTVDGDINDISVEDMNCSLSDGHEYESLLEVSTWHPDGTLLSVPGDPDIYVVDQGRLHKFDDEGVMASYGFWYDDVVPMSPRELDCWELGFPISADECYRAVRDNNGTMWLAYECENNAGRYRLPISSEIEYAVLQSWGIDYYETLATSLGVSLIGYPVGNGVAHLRDGALVSETGDSAVYAVNEGVALPILDWDVFVSMNLENREVIELPSDSLSEGVLGIGSCPNGPGCIDWERARQCGGAIDVTDFVGDGGTGGDGDDDTLPNDPDCEIDSDGDGFMNCVDNCPLHDNSDQRDIDNDGFGDSCDLDADGDGVANADDCDMFNSSVGECGGTEDPTPLPPESVCGDGADNDQDGDFDCDDSDCFGTSECQQSDDDDVVADDDDTTPPPSDDDDDNDVSSDDDDTSTGVTSILEIFYTPPAILAPYNYIQLSGEYTLANGSMGLLWTAGLATAVNASIVSFTLPGVESGDAFRFSIEFYDAPTGYLNWACVPPAPYSTQGNLEVLVDGAPVAVSLINNYLGGCEDFVVIP
jgi:hypothetical protein